MSFSTAIARSHVRPWSSSSSSLHMAAATGTTTANANANAHAAASVGTATPARRTRIGSVPIGKLKSRGLNLSRHLLHPSSPTLRSRSRPRSPSLLPSLLASTSIPRTTLSFTSAFSSSSSSSIPQIAVVTSSLSQRRLFSSTPSPFAMTATKINGTAIAKSVRESVRAQIEASQKINPRYKPSFRIIQVGGVSESSTYVRMKLKAAIEANIDCELVQFPDTVTEAELIDQIIRMNEDDAIHGIIVQLPLPENIDDGKVTSAIADEKDVDGFSTFNVGELAKRYGHPFFLPCTPKGVMLLLEQSGVDLKGKNAVVLGRSDLVGVPVSHLLLKADATVTMCHSRTANVENHIRQADVVIVAIGQPNYVKGEWLKPGAVVIDVGTTYIPDDTKKSGVRLVGDVHFESASEVASQITPVPGGVGPMTVAMLLQNVVDSATMYFERERVRQIVPLPLKLKDPVPSDIAVSRAQHPKQITRIAQEVGIEGHELEPYGAHKAKVELDVLKRLQHRRNGRYVVVTGITPTPLGEGKSTTTMGIAQAIGAHLNRLAFANVRQPSQGPTFGIKGGAAGGGYSQVIPMDEFNLHLTGDIHAITAANNLLAAAIETRMFHENTQKDAALYKRLVPAKKGKREFQPIMFRRLNKLGITKTNPDELTEDEINRFARLDIDPATITWRRVLDVNDRHLRGITVGTAPTEKGQTRETGFDISVASECMAILALSNSLDDMRERLGRMVIGSSRRGEPVTCDDIGAGGALTALMKDAIKPTLMQTLEGTPVFVHAGPFANISIGASSVLADKIALKLAGTEADENHNEKTGFVVTEAGFDFTMGGERFFNIKCRSSGLVPDVVVIVATVRALKVHGGGPPIAPGAALQQVYREENVELLRHGCVNLKKQIANARQYGVPVVVAINRFETDTPAELEVIRAEAIAAGAEDAIPANHWAEGGKGAVDLAKGVIAASEKEKNFDFLYSLEGDVQTRIEAIAKIMYGAEKVVFSELAQKKVDTYIKQGFGNLPICIAKTQYSLSHDPDLKGAPTGFTVPIRDVRLAAGAGYLYALAADIQTIPGLPTAPGYLNVDVDTETGEIDGLF
ncbi:FTHFS-domain-containing protein [Venustampulla echinocandica]|uniref:C-1-tetrahydrofolate synthase, cytoplasmic n=1 Tax=Venustampulla echinocandica TaxID=2656787 RepID=A0A370TQP4_9HELO|nr:FTHFS-domain-containing protein [Venustampulla echinocandica]RDL37856.1 FTHFS-domain-containing protein [Venustampulla echinocandica]